MIFLFYALVYGFIIWLLLTLSLRLHDMLRKYYFLFYSSGKASLFAFLFGALIWSFANWFHIKNFYIDIAIVAPVLCVLGFVILFYLLFMPAYVYWDLKDRIRNFVQKW